jgi:hypothetical protein
MSIARRYTKALMPPAWYDSLFHDDWLEPPKTFFGSDPAAQDRDDSPSLLDFKQFAALSENDIAFMLIKRREQWTN